LSAQGKPWDRTGNGRKKGLLTSAGRGKTVIDGHYRCHRKDGNSIAKEIVPKRSGRKSQKIERSQWGESWFVHPLVERDRRDNVKVKGGHTRTLNGGRGTGLLFPRDQGEEVGTNGGGEGGTSHEWEGRAVLGGGVGGGDPYSLP